MSNSVTIDSKDIDNKSVVRNKLDYTCSNLPFRCLANGINGLGNHWCRRDYGNGFNAYHYANRDGSHYWQNPDGSRYFEAGDGFFMYTSSDGFVMKKSN